MFLAFGMLAALLEARATGKGQVVDAAMVDGINALMTPFYGLRRPGCTMARAAPTCSTRAHPTTTVPMRGREYVSIAPSRRSSPPCLVDKLRGAGADVWACPTSTTAASGRVSRAFRAIFSQRTRAQWCEALEGTDGCFAPVLSPQEAPAHPHHGARQFHHRGRHHPARPRAAIQRFGRGRAVGTRHGRRCEGMGFGLGRCRGRTRRRGVIPKNHGRRQTA